MKRVLLVFGTRPEAIKMCPLANALAREKEEFDVSVCVTGQHREMLHQVLEVFGVTTNHDLDIMRAGQDLFDVTSRVLEGMRGVLAEARADLVLVHGDTTTSMAAALAAYYCRVPVGHVEAGLRTYNPYSPWPEEVNRQFTDRIAEYAFCPTETACRNLEQERVGCRLFVTGNTVIDALREVAGRLESDAVLAQATLRRVEQRGYDVGSRRDRRLVLVTSHRRESYGEGFRQIASALRDLAARYREVDFVFPMHPNPRVRHDVREVLEAQPRPVGNLFLIEPLDYLEFVCLLSRSYLVLTDSGGIQEEAPGLGKPVLVLRDETERPEAVAFGTVRLVGAHYGRIMDETCRLLDDGQAYGSMRQALNPYGDGKACRRIADILAGRDYVPFDCLASGQ